MKKTYILIVFLTILAFIFVIVAFVMPQNKQTPAINQIAPTPNPIFPTTKPSSNTTAAPTETTGAVPNSIPRDIPSDYPKNTAAISALIEKLPYTRVNFSLSYNYSEDSFLLLLSSAKSASGEAEFETFLKQNGILDKSWLKNLTLNYQ